MAAPPPQGQQPPLPPFRPSCIMCVSDCDGDSIFTSCHHFVCSRCVAKYPQGSCPRCRTPCRALRISAPNVAERIGGDAVKVMQQAMTMLDFQRRQEFNTTQRLKEMVSLFNGQLRQATAKVQELQSDNDRLKSEVATAAQARQAAEAQLLQLQQQHHHHGPPPVPSMTMHHPGSYTTMMPPSQMMMPPGSDVLHGASGSLPPGGGQNWMSPCRPPTATMGDVAGLFGTMPKRGRSETGIQGTGGGLPPSPGDRFILATPAMTLRGPPPTAGPMLDAHRSHVTAAPRLQSMLPGLGAAPPVVRMVHSSSGHSAPFKPG